MTTTTTTTAIVPFDPVFADPRRLALGGFLAGYSGLTRDAYELDLRQFIAWCDELQLDLFEVRRADIEVRPGPRRPRAGSSDGGKKAVHGDELLPVRRGGTAAGSLAGCPRPPTSYRL